MPLVLRVHVQGHAFVRGIYCDDVALAKMLEDFTEIEALSKETAGFNGNFSVVVEYRDGRVFLAVDPVRSYPLFYNNDGEWGYSAFDLAPGSSKVACENTAQFYKTGFTIGPRTLIPNVSQVIAGEHILLEKGSAISKLHEFLHFHPVDPSQTKRASLSDYYGDLEKVSLGFIDRLIASAGGKKLIIPLSGGYDSRYIVALLKLRGYDNILLVTYGVKDSFEVRIAEKVANEVGFPWVFVEYDANLLVERISSEEFTKYCHYASRGASLPHIQEFYAVYYLKHVVGIPADSIFVPGFCGDLLGGSYVPVEFKANKGEILFKESLKGYIYRRLFYLDNQIEKQDEQDILLQIDQSLPYSPSDESEKFCSVYEDWIVKHRVSRFVVNAVRAYEYYGYDWRMPLWDKELIEFWYNIPLELRFDKKLYDGFLFDNLFSKLNIDFKKDHHWLGTNSVGLLRPLLPLALKIPLKKLYYEIHRVFKNRRTYDQNGFSPMADYFSKEYEKSTGQKLTTSDSINQTESKWFIEYINSIEAVQTDKPKRFVSGSDRES